MLVSIFRIRFCRFIAKNIVVILAFGCLAYILYLRFQIGLTRFFDDDEFTHMMRSYLISSGQIPYRDFGYFYSPIFAALFAPFFVLLKEQATVVYLARSLEFAIFLAGVVAIFFLGREVAGTKTGFLAAFLWSFLPLGLDKTIEIRPDNLAIVFWLVSLLFLLKTRFFWAGIFFGLAVAVIIKIAFVYPGFVVFFLFNLKKDFHKSLKSIIRFHLAAILPILILLLFFLPFGVLGQAIYSIFIMPVEVSQAYGVKYFVPYFPFLPNDAFYGLPGKSLAWFLSNLILVLGLVGLVRSRIKTVLIPAFFSVSLALLYLYRITLVQYFLPILLILVWGAAELLADLFDFVCSRTKLVFVVLWLIFLGTMTYGFRQTGLIHLRWGNSHQVWLVSTVLAYSQPGDYFFDGTGYHLFRPSGYWLCCEFFGDWAGRLSRPLPDFIDSLKATQTKYVLEMPRIGRLAEKDRKFIKDNYFPTAIKNLLMLGK